MKNTDVFNRFEELLKSKSFLELSAEERLLVSEFATETEYENMAAMLAEIDEINSGVTLPEGGAEAVWQKYSASEISVSIPLRKRRVSVLWPIGLAASFVLLLFLKIPSGNSVLKSAANRNITVYTFAFPVQREVIKEIPVYIRENNYSDIVYNERVNNLNYDASVYVPDPETITKDKAQRQGVNTRELGELSNLFVSVN